MTKNPWFLYITVFTAGMTSLMVELSASRLLGNTFGTSNLVWACIIGLILIYLTLGYFVGGRLADRHPSPRLFYSILAWASLAVGLVPIISRPVLRISANAFDQLQLAVLFGSFVTVLNIIHHSGYLAWHGISLCDPPGIKRCQSSRRRLR